MIIARDGRGKEIYGLWEEKKIILGVEDSLLDLENAWRVIFLRL
jgi:hypothetical protein